jgi:hypothetical protein
MEKREPSVKELRTAEAWPQGFGWWVIYRSGGKVYRWFSYGQQPPKGVKNVRQGKGEAYRGIQQHMGKESVDIEIPMGIQTVHITNPNREPGKSGAIEFSRNLVSGTPVDKTQIPVQKPAPSPKKRKRISEYDRMTSLKGFRIT